MPGYWGELWGKNAGRSGTLGSHAWGTLPIDEFGRYGNFIARAFAGSYWAAETYTGYGRYVATAGVPITSTRLHYRHDKRTFSLVWPQVGTNAPQVYVRDMITSASTVELAYHGGTYTCYPVPGSLRCSETGYYVYDISAQFTEA